MHVTRPHNCECHRCIDEHKLGQQIGFMWVPLSSTKMILCPVCGCKRCPRASDHDLACTDSNDPGQPGSVYQ
ncbi:Uncharacterized protein AC511_1518 [Pseudomonas coronafaciens pv. oryzae]|nr:Uncharacterized protein AC511_1518 [Pseudomonas coronafaciens pv. oryzae]